jgi:hypothetical protein
MSFTDTCTGAGTDTCTGGVGAGGAVAGEVAVGAPDGDRIEVGGIHVETVDRRRKCRADGTRTAAEIHDDRPPPTRGFGALRGPPAGDDHGLVGQELGTAAGDEDAGIHGDSQAVELGPAHDVFEWQPGDAAVDHGGELGRVPGGGQEQFRLVLGEDATGGAESCDGSGFVRG